MKNQKGFSLIELLIVIVIIGIIAAIAIPSLLRARVSANEAGTIGDHRAMSSAMVAYSSANGGFFDSTITCLSTPDACIPQYPATAPTFLGTDMATDTLTKSGYDRTFTPGDAPTAVNTAVNSPSSATNFCYSAIPSTAGRTGVRAFGIDGAGSICFNNLGTAVGCTNTGLPVGSADCLPLP